MSNSQVAHSRFGRGGAVGFAGFTYREEIQKCGPFETQQGSPRQRGVQKRGLLDGVGSSLKKPKETTQFFGPRFVGRTCLG